MKRHPFFLLALLLLSCQPADPGPSSDGRQDTAVNDKQSRPAATVTADSPPADSGYDTYCNAGFGYCIDYPAGILTPQPEAPNGDGCIFLDSQAQEVLRVFGRNNMDPNGDPLTLEQQFREDVRDLTAKGDSITYQKLGAHFFVISGYRSGNIFYQKTITKDGAFAYALMQYPKERKDAYNPISARISTSFR